MLGGFPVGTVGYIGQFCQTIDSNNSIYVGQYAAAKCYMRSQQCESDKRSTKKQCAYCESSSSKACCGHGTCLSNFTNPDALCAAEDGSESNSAYGSLGGDVGRELVAAGQENATGGVSKRESGCTGAQCDRQVEKKFVILDDLLSGSDNEDNEAMLFPVSDVFICILLLTPLILVCE
ncbi:unnamed protein product [Albugo candida]|uniref:Uncharacterized protein n=1 Tax=Albugo candida TaxID=65357 RepID=A0A024GFS0_9STRA|nr:unnamed protein product [Albugo candida]|eukprot:CCI45363.1 unnamed protein product [Albugo candida]